jgi:glycosyltransferase involved in cell wall biosynthesis
MQLQKGLELINNKKILVILPSLNEEGAIREVIADIKKFIVNSNILVIDGYSSDNTVNYSRKSGAKTISIDKNFGIGLAVEAGLMAAYKGNYDYLLRIDSDGQHPPKEALKILKKATQYKYDLTIGSRFLGKSKYEPNSLRLVSIKLICFLLRLLHGASVTDCTSGCQIISKRLIKNLVLDKKFEYSEIRIIWMAKKMGFKVVEEFINMKPREIGVSSFSPFIAFKYMFENLIDLVASVKVRLKKKL